MKIKHPGDCVCKECLVTIMKLKDKAITFTKAELLCHRIKYCEEQNGMPVCKNCGIDEEAITEALEEAYERGVKAGIAMK